MRIIEKGEVPGTKPIECRCQKCKTLFEFLPFEAQFVSDQRDGDAYKIACPVCRTDCWVDARKAR